MKGNSRAAVVLAGAGVIALLAGCSGAGGTTTGAPSTSSSAEIGAASSFSVSMPPATPAYPDTPEGDLDKWAAGQGLTVNDLYEGSPAAYVQDICESMSNQQSSGTEPGEWLAVAQKPDADETAILRQGMPKLCPKWSRTALDALKGDYVHTYSDGTFTVKSEPGTDAEAIAPGRYRTTGQLQDCYWERTSRSGEILANQFATAAQEITVVIRSSDGFFTSRSCGTWKPVG
ncbi:hypothetical protein ABZ404_11055 [Streptomyces sp. NPDC005878]